MTHRKRLVYDQSITRRTLRCSQGAKLVVWGFAVMVALAVPADLYANQVYKACGPKWLKKAQKLDAEQQAWLFERRIAEFAVDLDGDGSSDVIRMTSNPSFRDCDLRKNWNLKETSIRIEFGNGKTQLFFWINPNLAETMRIVREIGRILVSGVDADGRSISKWIDYRKGAPPPPTLVAERDPEGAEGARIASLSPQPVAQVAAAGR